MADTKVLLFTLVVVALLLYYAYWQNRTRPGGWIPEAAREQVNRERRVPPRVRCSMDVLIRAGQRTVAGTAENIAIGGVLLRPSASLSVGEPVHVTFELPNGPCIDIPGAVCRKQGDNIAVKFDFVTEQRALIQHWVDQQIL